MSVDIGRKLVASLTYMLQCLMQHSCYVLVNLLKLLRCLMKIAEAIRDGKT